ncbi:MAG: polysaccharide deacetylase family protein [Anaerolineales bacterium]
MKPITRRDFLKLSGLALMSVASGRYVPAQAGGDYFTAPLLWHGSRRYKNIAFTYDDCNSLVRLQRVEKLLDEYPEFKVTFFPIGLKIPDLNSKDKGIWKRFVEKGHEIGYHTYEHVNLGVMSYAGALMDFDRWQRALNDALGAEYPTRFIRPPYNIVSQTLDFLCRERGLVAAEFSIGGGGEPDVVLRAIQNTKGGDIVQMHIRTEDYESSKLAFPWLQENQWDLVTMSRLYDDYLREQVNSDGCDTEASGLTRTCVE